jgi:hypothetical protein
MRFKGKRGEVSKQLEMLFMAIILEAYIEYNRLSVIII